MARSAQKHYSPEPLYHFEDSSCCASVNGLHAFTIFDLMIRVIQPGYWQAQLPKFGSCFIKKNPESEFWHWYVIM
jgi:hypothetical protein